MSRKPIEEQIRESEERLKQLKAKAAQLAAKERAALKAKQRQEDTRRKIQHGGLVVLAGLAELDKGVLLGALLDVADRLNSSDQRDQLNARFKGRGDHLLASQAASNQKSAAAQAQTEGGSNGVV